MSYIFFANTQTVKLLEITIFAKRMARKFQIFLMLFCLALYTAPKQFLHAQNIGMTCNSSAAEKKSCCDKESSKKPCSNEKQKKGHCDGNCKDCNFCGFSTVFFTFQQDSPEWEVVEIQSVKEEKFTYITPEVSDIFSKIWQPPKIG